MNASAILRQLMQEAGKARGGAPSRDAGAAGASARGAVPSGSGSGGLGGLLRGLASQLTGSRASARGASGGAGQLDLQSLLGTGALSLLMGSGRGRRLGRRGLKYTALAAAGSLAWSAWQNYQARQQQGPGAGAATAGSDSDAPVEHLEGEAAERRSLEILQAMIMAARADGHIDEQERAQLAGQLDQLGADPELRQWAEQQLRAPLDAKALARQADSPQAAREIYLVSVAMVDEQHARERAWLDELARELDIPPELARELEQQVEQASATR